MLQCYSMELHLVDWSVGTVSDLLGEFSHYSATYPLMQECGWPVETVSDLLGEFSRYSHSWLQLLPPPSYIEMSNLLLLPNVNIVFDDNYVTLT